MPLQQPRRTKFLTQHRGTRKGKATRGNFLAFGDLGIQALGPAWVSAAQIEAVRVVLTKNLGRGGKVWVRIFPDKPVSKKPAETRMGKGKGDTDHWVAVVKPGRILFETAGTSPSTMIPILQHAIQKLSFPCRIVQRFSLPTGGRK